MTDYGHELQFGAFIAPSAAAAERVLELAKLADVLGLDLVSDAMASHFSYEERELIEPLARLGFY